MRAPRISLIHALRASITPIGDAFAHDWPEATLANLLDDSLSADLARDGRITTAMTRRFIELARYAQGTGADAILFSCTAFNRCIDAARVALDIPVLKPDEAMIERALNYGPRLGLVTTFLPTLASATEQIQIKARSLGIVPELESHLVDGALAALQAGDGVTHDRLIAASVESLADCDVVMLAQFSMARAAANLSSKVPVLTSPDTAVEKLRGLLS